MNERARLLDNDSRVTVKLRSDGQRFINGVSSSYENVYHEELSGIITESELTDIIKRLNETIQSFWPCTACYVFGFVCSPFTLGTSLFCPHYCISQSDEHAQRMLEQISLKAKYYDRKITFRIVKQCCNSYVEISFPESLLHTVQTEISELEDGKVSHLNSESGNMIELHHSVVLSPIFSVQPGGASRLKDS